ncbi:glycosyltransferase family 9 protein [uncultured Lacinutrix sp.]|uniref:glycosyltransferase family 9 protein n=1 Tax=uncultured Lacinutrix sp. TaxID=574032 RepID=UPI0026224BD9|nr:glycosyltransferase family 9 protein [uncultured Lacinutrix sp.]
MKILVIQQKMIGDVLTTSILFEALRAKYPEAQLDYLINSHTLAVVENNKNIDNFVLFTKAEENSKLALLKFAKALKQKKYDVIIDVYSKISSNIITLFSGAKTKISYYKHYTTFVYNFNIKRLNKTESKSGLAIVNRLQLLNPLGIETTQAKPKIYLTPEEVANSKQFLKDHDIDFSKPLYMISVLGSGTNKTYPFTFMAKVIDRIAKQTGGQLLFNYIPNQKAQAQAIYDLCKPETQKLIFFNVFGKNLREFLAITKHCDALIGNEGGAVNMAKALDIKTFAIFSPWISKDDWSLFEDDKQNVSVHLKDYKPGIYSNTTEKEMKKEALELYQQFSPDFFDDKLNLFLQQTTNH